MRSAIFLATILIISPAIAHTGHVETAGGHSHWFDLAVIGLAGLALAVWLVSKVRTSPVTDNG
jgi:hypothetical protein